jgi:hypothetical protein
MGKVRTDSTALTLDKFLNKSSNSEVAHKAQVVGVNTLIPVKLASVKKLLY